MTATYTYDEKSKITSYSEKYIDGYADSVQILFYDKHGNLKTVQYGDRTVSYENTYKNGRLTKRVEGGIPTIYKYKKISVDRKLAARIAAQQKRLLNPLLPGMMQ